MRKASSEAEQAWCRERARERVRLVFQWRSRLVTVADKLQALVYDILPSTTAVFCYAIGSRKLSANEQGFLLLVVVVLKQ